MGTTIIIPAHAKTEFDEMLKLWGVGGYFQASDKGERELGRTYFYRNNPYSGEKGTTTFRTGDLLSEILAKMISSSRVFEFGGNTAEEVLHNIRMHVAARVSIVASAISKGFSFPTPNPAAGTGVGVPPFLPKRVNKDYWVEADVMRKDKNATDALQDIWDNPNLYEIGCEKGAQYIILHGISRAMANDCWKPRRELFDKIAAEKLESGLSPYSTFATYTDKARRIEDSDWIPGDWGILVNRNKNFKPGEEGENIIYLGGGNFFGHPGGVQTMPQWNTTIQSWGQGGLPPKLDDWRVWPLIGLKVFEEKHAKK